MEEAIEKMSLAAPDIVLTDIGLPGIDGIAGIKILREKFPELPCLALTVYDDDERIFAALCAGAIGYLLKNTQPARLLEHGAGADPLALLGDVGEAILPTRAGLMRHPEPGQGEVPVRLLPAEPAVARQPRREDHRARVIDLYLGGDACNGASSPPGGLVQPRHQSG